MDGLELRAARALFARANRLRNEIEQATSRDAAQDAAVRFVFGVREVAQTLARPTSAVLGPALDYLGRLTTPLFAFEVYTIARTMLARAGGEPE